MHTSFRQGLMGAIKKCNPGTPRIPVIVVTATRREQTLQETPAAVPVVRGSRINLLWGTRFAGPEGSEVYELGLKTPFERLSFNRTVFDQTITNFQTNVFTDYGFVLANAAEQSTLGVEFDFTWNPYARLILSGGATFLDPVYDNFPNFWTGLDISGRQPQGIAETQFSLAANYGFTIGSLDAFVRADWQHIGDSPFFDDPAPVVLRRMMGGVVRRPRRAYHWHAARSLIAAAIGDRTASNTTH
jgi:outer membrane receptor protein involved in Fe transport